MKNVDVDFVDDFPSYGSASGRQEETLGHWTLPSPPPPSTGRASSPSGRQQTSLEKRLGLEGRQNIYRSHKQLPFSLRVTIYLHCYRNVLYLNS